MPAETTTVSDIAAEDVITAAEQATNAPAPTPKKLSLPVVQHMRKAGLITTDEEQTALTVLKRVNHAIYASEPIGKIPELQRAFREQLAAAGGDITKLTEGGVESPVFRMVDAYLAERVAHYEKSVRELTELPQPSLGSFELGQILARATKKAQKYAGERAAYAGMPELINATVAKYPQVFDAYYNIGELAERSGIVKGEPAAVHEKLDEVIAEVVASRLFDVAPKIMSLPKTTLQAQADFPEEYKTNIIFVAEDTALHTTGLERLNLFDTPNTSPELRQIQALNNLLSAHLHALTSHNRNSDGSTNPPVQELANNLASIPELVRGYQMAGASLVHNFLIDGASAADAKMQSLDGSFTELAESRRIPLVGADEAKRKAVEMVTASAALLRNKFAGKSDLLAKVDTLVAQATGQSAEKGFAAKEETPASTFAADAVKGTGAAIAR